MCQRLLFLWPRLISGHQPWLWRTSLQKLIKVTDMERGGEETVNFPLPIRKSILWGHCLLLGDPLPSLDHKAPDQSRWVSKKRGKRNSLPGLAPLCAEWTHFLHRSSKRGTGFHTLPFQIPNYSLYQFERFHSPSWFTFLPSCFSLSQDPICCSSHF